MLLLLFSNQSIPEPLEAAQLIGPPASTYASYDKKRQAAYDEYMLKLKQQRNLQIVMLAL